jgi:hypothetical protein
VEALNTVLVIALNQELRYAVLITEGAGLRLDLASVEQLLYNLDAFWAPGSDLALVFETDVLNLVALEIDGRNIVNTGNVHPDYLFILVLLFCSSL